MEVDKLLLLDGESKKCDKRKTIDIGLQTDLVDDPDIYYFAGGRTVAFQTDHTEDYPPLALLPREKTTGTNEELKGEKSQDVDLKRILFNVKVQQRQTSLVPGGIIRSKSMINSVSTRTGTKKSLIGNTKGLSSTTTNSSTSPTSYSKGIKGTTISTNTGGIIKRGHSNSFVSLDESRRRIDVDADGWETVKTRASRSKWSSNSSLGSSGRGSMDKGQGVGVLSSKSTKASTSTTFPVKTATTTTLCKSKPASKDIKSSRKSSSNYPQPSQTSAINVDRLQDTKSPERNEEDEEIQKKEADLDDAIRQEELLEEELRQVEKEFESIENDSVTAVSPAPEVDVDDSFFFISIDGEGKEDFKETERIISLREKLMSPARKRDGEETLKRVEAKLAKAERNREKLLQSKFNRYVELSDRFEALNETTKKLVQERAQLISKAEGRRRRAAQKRKEYLKNIKRKAHDEDSKAKEIAFIVALEAQNKRHDYFASAQEVEERLQTMQEERRVRLEERAKKATAVIRRQSRIKRDWQAKLNSLQEKQRQANERIMREKEERAKERVEMAQEKARDREERISALNAMKLAEKEELQKKIKQKQEETARRHEENMEQIRQKAIGLGTHRVQEENASYRVCTLCNIIITSGIHEMQHVRSRSHLDAVKKAATTEGYGLKFIADVAADKIEPNVQLDKNRNKGMKKHGKKLMQKLLDNGKEFEKSVEKKAINKSCDPNLRAKMRRNILELDRLISLFSGNKGAPNLVISVDRLIADIRRTSVQNIYIKEAIIGLNGMEVALKVLQCKAVDLPTKSKILAVEMIHGFIIGNIPNSLYILRGTGICTLIDLITERWNNLIPEDKTFKGNSTTGKVEGLPTDDIFQQIVTVLFAILECIPDPFNGIQRKGSYLTQDDVQSIKSRTCDVIGYLVASGVIDRISVYCGGVCGPVDNSPNVAVLLMLLIDFLVLLLYSLQFCHNLHPPTNNLSKTCKDFDPTQLIATLEASELAGSVSMSYSLLLHQGAPSRPRITGTGDSNGEEVQPPPPGEKTAEVVKSTLCLINAMARLDPIVLQNILASETLSLQFRHISSQLLWQLVPHRHSPLMRRILNELIIAIAHFTVGNRHNQSTIQSGQTPTVLQLLCSLPKEYFVDGKLKHNFLTTLLAASKGCPENQGILIQNNINLEILDNYLNSEEGKLNKIIQRMHFQNEQEKQRKAVE